MSIKRAKIDTFCRYVYAINLFHIHIRKVGIAHHIPRHDVFDSDGGCLVIFAFLSGTGAGTGLRAIKSNICIKCLLCAKL